MEDKDKTKSEIMEEYLAEITKTTEVNTFELKRECCEAANKIQRYIEDLYHQKRILNKLHLILKKKEGELFEYYKTKFEIKLTSSQDIRVFIERDDKFQSIKKHYLEQEAIVEFLQDTIKNLSQRGWLLQKAVELEKIQ